MPVMSWCVSSCDKWPVWWGTWYQRGLTQERFPGSIELGQELPGCYRIPWGYSLRLVQGLSPKSLNNIFLSTLPFCLEIEKSLLREPLSELSSALAVMSGTFLGHTRQRVLDGVFSIPESSGHRSSRTWLAGKMSPSSQTFSKLQLLLSPQPLMSLPPKRKGKVPEGTWRSLKEGRASSQKGCEYSPEPSKVWPAALSPDSAFWTPWFLLGENWEGHPGWLGLERGTLKAAWRG